MATAPAADIRVVDVPDRSRFEVRVDGEVAGFTEYCDGSGTCGEWPHPRCAAPR